MVLLALCSCSNDLDNQDELQPFTITYVGNGHSVGIPPEDNKSYYSNESAVVLSQGTLKKAGFIFNGWNSKENGSGRSYAPNDELTISNTNVILYAQWLPEIAYNDFVPSNVSRIDILNVLGLPENDWYYATVDIVNGSLTLKDGQNDSKFQFKYKGESNNPPSNNHGFLRISQQSGFRTATHAGKVRALAQGISIEEAIFDDSNIAEISGALHNWGNLDRVFIPAKITIADHRHYGYLEVSFNDLSGQLTIHATAYNRKADTAIVTGKTH